MIMKEEILIIILNGYQASIAFDFKESNGFCYEPRDRLRAHMLIRFQKILYRKQCCI